MKKLTILLGLAVFLAVSCEKNQPDSRISNVSFTPCQQDSETKSKSLSDKTDVEFTNDGVKIMCPGFVVACDFTTVNVTHTFENGVLNITQQGYPNQAKCLCYTDVSYTIEGVLQNKVNVIFINGEQVYCHNNGNNQSDCDQDVIISQTEYNNAQSDPVTIIDMNIEGNCLKIKFGASGCSGDNWVVKLIDSEAVAESLPCQRALRLCLGHIGICAAYFENEISFNIESLQIQGNRSVQLNILGKSILYEY